MQTRRVFSAFFASLREAYPRAPESRDTNSRKGAGRAEKCKPEGFSLRSLRPRVRLIPAPPSRGTPTHAKPQSAEEHRKGKKIFSAFAASPRETSPRAPEPRDTHSRKAAGRAEKCKSK